MRNTEAVMPASVTIAMPRSEMKSSDSPKKMSPKITANGMPANW